MRRWFAAWCVVWAVLSSSVPAHAQSEPPPASTAEQVRADARVAFHRGVEAARAGHWEEARLAFAHSFELVPSAVTLLNLAGTQINTGRLVEGYGNYRRILRAPADAASHREQVKRVLADLERRIPRLRVVLERRAEGDAVWVDGAPVALGSADHVIVRLDPGAHHVELQRAGTSEQRDVALSEGQELTLELEAHAPNAAQASDGGAPSAP